MEDYTEKQALKDVKEINELLECSNSDNLNVTNWEQDFMKSVKDWETLSEKQIAVVKKVAAKI